MDGRTAISVEKEGRLQRLPVKMSSAGYLIYHDRYFFTKAKSKRDGIEWCPSFFFCTGRASLALQDEEYQGWEWLSHIDCKLVL